MEKNERISVIVPVYNIEQYLPACIESILAQTYTNLEIILVDDGATDNSGRICDEYAAKDSRIRVIHKPNGGVSSARNAGLDAATGSLIGFVDGDDTIAPEMYQTLYSDLCEFDADIAHCGYEIVWHDRVELRNEVGERLTYDRIQGLKKLLLGRIEPSLCNKLYRGQLFENIRLNTNIRVNEDLLINYYLFNISKRTTFNGICFYRYIHRTGSCTMSSFSEKQLDQITVARIIKSDIENSCPELKDYGMRRLVGVLISVYNHSLNQEKYRDLRKSLLTELKQNRSKVSSGEVYSKTQKIAVLLMTTYPPLYHVMLRIRNYRYRYRKTGN